MTPTVRFNTVSKHYGSAAAVDAVSFEIEKATLVTLLGPSGCGKTTTLRLIAGLEHATGGRIEIDGRDVTKLAASERDVSMVFQSYALFPHMNVLENTSYGLRASGLNRARAEAAAREKLALVGLAGFEMRLPSELSGGQQQRVAVARAIVLEPKVLLFDEPLSNLDARLRRRVREEIRGLQQQLGLTVVYVTHDQEEALAVSDRIIVMKDGRIAQDGAPRALYERPASRFIADFIGNANLADTMVTRLDADRVEIVLAGMKLVLRDADASVGPALLAIRPHAISWGDGLPGTIAKAAYLGSHMEYEIVVPGLPEPLFAIIHDVARPRSIGDQVRLGFDPTGLALVPRD